MVYRPGMRRTYAAFGGVPSNEAYIQTRIVYEDADQKTYDDFATNELEDQCADRIGWISADKYSVDGGNCA